MKTYRYKLILVVGLIVLGLAACAPANPMPTALLPAGMAYADGKEIYFIHTETSDASLAELLTKMMNSPVLHVPSLANSASGMTAQVFVFDNGIKGMGPLGFQADVFDNPPGSTGYTPLRQVNIVTWADPSKARMMKSAQDVLAAEKAGEVKIKPTGSIVNMPFVVWDGGKR